MKEVGVRDLPQDLTHDPGLELLHVGGAEKAQPLNEVPETLAAEIEHLDGLPTEELDPAAVLQVENLLGPVGDEPQGIVLEGYQTGEVRSLLPAGGDPDAPPRGQGLCHGEVVRRDDLAVGIQTGIAEDPPTQADDADSIRAELGKGPADCLRPVAVQAEIVSEEDAPTRIAVNYQTEKESRKRGRGREGGRHG